MLLHKAQSIAQFTNRTASNHNTPPQLAFGEAAKLCTRPSTSIRSSNERFSAWPSDKQLLGRTLMLPKSSPDSQFVHLQSTSLSLTICDCANILTRVTVLRIVFATIDPTLGCHILSLKFRLGFGFANTN